MQTEWAYWLAYSTRNWDYQFEDWPQVSCLIIPYFIYFLNVNEWQHVSRACSPTDDRFIRMMLVRLRGHSQEVPVRQICGRHAALLPPQRAMLRQHVLQAAHDTDLGKFRGIRCINSFPFILEFYVHVDGPRPSVCYPLAGLNLRSLTIELSSYCNDRYRLVPWMNKLMVASFTWYF